MYPPVIKHGVLEDTQKIGDFPIETAISNGFASWPRLMTPEDNLAVQLPRTCLNGQCRTWQPAFFAQEDGPSVSSNMAGKSHVNMEVSGWEIHP